jgi:hypothetical protein
MLHLETPGRDAVELRYWARIKAILSKLAAHSGSAASGKGTLAIQSGGVPHGVNKMLESQDFHAPMRSSIRLSDGTRQTGLLSSTPEVVGDIAGFEIAKFVRDLDALRLRMMSVPLRRRALDVQYEIVKPGEGRHERHAGHAPASDRASCSVRDAIAGAVLLLPRRDEEASRT